MRMWVDALWNMLYLSFDLAVLGMLAFETANRCYEFYPVGIYLFKFNNRTLEQEVEYVHFEHISHLGLVFLLLTLNI